MSISAFLDYISLEKNCSSNTLKAYKANLNGFEDFILSQDPHSNLELVNYVQIRSWIVELIEIGCALGVHTGPGALSIAFQKKI